MSDEPEGLDLPYPNEPEYEVATEKTKVFGNASDDKEFKKVEGKSADHIKTDESKKEEPKKVEIKTYAKGKDDFEKAKEWLIRQQYEEFEDPTQKYCEFTIPKMVKLGEELVIKLSNKVKNAHYLFGDGYKWDRVKHYDPKSEYDIQLKPTVQENITDFNKDEIRIPIGKIKKINRVDYETWLTGYYYCVVRVFGKEWHEDVVIKRMVKVIE